MKKPFFARHALAVWATSLLGACASAPFVPPAVEIPAAYQSNPADTADTASVRSAADGSRWTPARPAEAAERGPWWLVFNDPALNALIAEASAANQELAGASARVKLARALAGGGAAGSFSNILEWSSRSWVLGAMLASPLLDGGRHRAMVAGSEAVLEQSVASYRQSVLLAFAEVEDKLAGLRILSAQAGELDQAVVSARRAVVLAHALYDAGRSSYLELLDAQRHLASIERSAVQLRGQRAVTTVALIRTLGGSWDNT